MLLEAIAPVHVRQAQGWSKADPKSIAAAREQALKSPVYQKLSALKGWKDTSTKIQIKNGTINFKINDIVDVQCTSSLAVRFQGPDDHTSRKMEVPNEVEGMPLDQAYVAMLQLIYNKFKNFGSPHDIASADGYKGRLSGDLSLKYRGISSLKGMNNTVWNRVDLSDNALEDLTCERVKIQFLIAAANPLKTLENMPECQTLDIRHLPTVLNFNEEWKHIPKSLKRIYISAKSSKNIGALFQCNSLDFIGINVASAKNATASVMSYAQHNWFGKKLEEIMASSHRTKGMLELQQWLSDNDFEELIDI